MLKRILIICTLMLSTSLVSQSQLPGKTVDTYKAGFTIWNAIDYSRSTKYEAATDDFNICHRSSFRQLRIWCWYPSSVHPTKQSNMTIGAYMAAGFNDKFEGMPSVGAYRDFIRQKYGLKKDQCDKVLGKTTEAYYNAPVTPGQHPLIIVGQGYNYSSPFAQYKLCEMLASKGFIVVSTPLQGAVSEYPSVKVQDLDAAAKDLLFLIGETERHFPGITDLSSIGISGFDLGGMAAVIAHMQNPNISAIATLDAGIIMDHNLPLMKDMPAYSPAALTAPLLHITRSKENSLKMGLLENTELLDYKGTNSKCIIRINNIRHSFFTAYAYEGLIANEYADANSYISDIYSIVCDFFCKHAGLYESDPAHDSFYTFLSLMADKGEMEGKGFEMEYYESTEGLIGITELEYLISQLDSTDLKQFANKISGGDSYSKHFDLSEASLTRLAYNVFYESARVEEGIELFRLATVLYPGSDNCFGNLGRAQIMAGDYSSAFTSYEEAVQLSPDNQVYVRMFGNLKRALNR